MNPLDPIADAGAGASVEGRTSVKGSDSDIRQAAQQFESLFMEQLIRQMRDAQLSEGFFGKGAGSSIYEGMFSSTMADHLTADSPLGIAKLLEQRWIGEASGTESAQQALRTVQSERAARSYRSAAIADVSPEHTIRKTPGVSREYGWGQHPIEGKPRFHHGIDLPSATGTPVLSVAPGRVVSTETTPGYGLSVVIQHAAGWTTRYAHLSAAEAEVGQRIGRGQMLGRVGSSGRSTGPHLHFEALHEGRRIDPALAAPGELRPQVLGPNADENHVRKR